MTSAHRQLLFGLHIDAMQMTEVIEACHQAVLERRRLLLGVLNAAKLVKLHKDKILRDALVGCDLLLADGQSVVWASWILGRPLPERVAGIDIFERLLELADRQSLAVALLGATPDVLQKVEAVLARRFPAVRIVYSHHGFYTAGEAAGIAQAIASSGADMLFLGMTSPKKEIFLGSYGAELNVPVLHGVGGAFDIMAGLTVRAPLRWQKLGMEWAFRLLQEPRRLGWRYLSTNLGFIRLTLGEMLYPATSFSGETGSTRSLLPSSTASRRLGSGIYE